VYGSSPFRSSVSSPGGGGTKHSHTAGMSLMVTVTLAVYIRVFYDCVKPRTLVPVVIGNLEKRLDVGFRR
jgi:hypothetical protein